MTRTRDWLAQVLWTAAVVGVLVLYSAGPTLAQCPGDCNGDGSATAADVMKVISIINFCQTCPNSLIGGVPAGCAGSLSDATGKACVNADVNANSCITASELQRIIVNMLTFPDTGCPAGTATPTNTPVNTPTNTPVSTVVNTAVNTPTNTPVNTPTNTAINTAANTPTNTPLNTPTNTAIATAVNTATVTATLTNTRTPSTTPTATPSFTATPPPSGFTCGNGVKETPLGEECDDGGECVGGDNAGDHCTSDADCHGPTLCLGIAPGKACSSDADCAGARCGKCSPHGGDGCASNCTLERSVPATLIPGVPQSNPTGLAAGTSGAIVGGGIGTPNLALPLSGFQIYTVGNLRDGMIPFVQRAGDSSLPKIPISTVACACVRSVAVKTCGGTVFEPDGVTQSDDCSPGFLTGTCNSLYVPGTPTPTFKPGTPTPVATQPRSCRIDLDCSVPNPTPATNPPHCVGFEDPCAGTGKKCAFVHGAGNGTGNSASGLISCNPGLEGVNLMFSQNANSVTQLPTPQPPPGTPPVGQGPPVLDLTGTGVAGDAIVVNSSAIGQITGICQKFPVGTQDKFTYGVDGKFCTDDDPGSSRGSPQTLPQTTEMATGLISHSSRSFQLAADPNLLCDQNDHPEVNCICTFDPTATPCNIGPKSVSGHPFSCNALTQPTPSVSGAGVVGSFVTVNLPTVFDSVVINQFYFQ